MRVIPIERDHKRGATAAFNNPGSGNADHASMPALPINDHAKRFTKLGILFQAGLNLVHDAAFFFLPLAIESVEACRQFARSRYVFHVEELDDILRNIHAPRGIEAWRNSEGDLTRSKRTRGPQLGYFQ